MFDAFSVLIALEYHDLVLISEMIGLAKEF